MTERYVISSTGVVHKTWEPGTLYYKGPHSPACLSWHKAPMAEVNLADAKKICRHCFTSEELQAFDKKAEESK